MDADIGAVIGGLLLAAICVLTLAGFFLRHGLSGLMSTPKLITVRRIDWEQLHLALSSAEPWLLSGLPATPPLEAWHTWQIHKVSLLFSPSSVFGTYSAPTRLNAENGEVVWSDGQARGRCRPQSVVQQVSLGEAQRMRLDSRFYLRGTAHTSVRQRLATELGLKLSNLTAYQSGEGAVTSLHWDLLPGLLSQTLGEKEVVLFAKSAMPEPATEEACWRRSYVDSRSPPPGGLRVVLRAGEALFLPAGVAHHVRSLSPVTLGSVWRL